MQISTSFEPSPDRGLFIVSLDCEGKWGMADHIGPDHERFLTRENLIRAYADLTTLFRQYDLPATFAFVMAFLLSADEQKTMAAIADVEIQGSNWLLHYREAQRRGNLEGWTCPEAIDIVRTDPRHEIACHGFTHVPLYEGGISADHVTRELAAAHSVATMKGVTLETFVYLRNQIGHEAELLRSGFKGYRGRLRALWSGAGGRITSLAREANILERAQAPGGVSHGMEVIPAGHFINWQTGLRRAVPRHVSRLRWRHILRDAADRKRVAHLWLHPHNLISGPATLGRLEDILIEAARLRASGSLDFVTQAQYVALRNSAMQTSDRRPARIRANGLPVRFPPEHRSGST